MFRLKKPRPPSPRASYRQEVRRHRHRLRRVAVRSRSSPDSCTAPGSSARQSCRGCCAPVPSAMAWSWVGTGPFSGLLMKSARPSYGIEHFGDVDRLKDLACRRCSRRSRRTCRPRRGSTVRSFGLYAKPNRGATVVLVGGAIAGTGMAAPADVSLANWLMRDVVAHAEVQRQRGVIVQSSWIHAGEVRATQALFDVADLPRRTT